MIAPQSAFQRNRKMWLGVGIGFVGLMIGKQALWSLVSGEVTESRTLQHKRALMEQELSDLNKKHKRIRKQHNI